MAPVRPPRPAESIGASAQCCGRQVPAAPQFLRSCSLQFELGDLTETIVIEQIHQASKFFGRDRQHFRRWSIGAEPIEPVPQMITVAAPQRGGAGDFPAATLLLIEETLLVNHLTARNGRQELPEDVAIGNLRELAASGALVQAP
jgi:hypothetical protein